jgi:Lipopolysaccharide kinase (Kdo/WaaP) family
MKLLEFLLPIAVGCGFLLALSLLLARRVRGRTLVEIQPRYRQWLGRLGLVRAEQFLSLSGTIISGHPDRNVQRLTLEAAGERVAVYLKREHRVSVWVRFLNALAGFGFVSRSVREACILEALRRESIGCPEWIAAGEDGCGRAFLMVREVEDAVDVRTFLRDHAEPTRRRQVARRLGNLIAHLHRTGFDHPDLYAKHVLVRLGDDSLVLLDWQRSRRRLVVSWRQRVRNLAALNATMADDVATSRDRLACLQTYLDEATDVPHPLVRRACLSVQHQTARLLRRRHIREKRQFPLPAEAQDWIALDGEALAITSALQRLVSGSLDWLALDQQPLPPGQTLMRRWLMLGNGRRTLLVRRRCLQPFAALWAWLRRRRLASPEQRHASLLLRLERHGVPAPRVLAMGQRRAYLGQLESFLLTEPAKDTVPLDVWLMWQTEGRRTRSMLRLRRKVLREAGALLARLHEASCYLSTTTTGCPLAVRITPEGTSQVVLAGVEEVQPMRRACRRLAGRDVRELLQMLSAAGCKPASLRRFVAAYDKTPSPIRIPVPLGTAANARQRVRQLQITPSPELQASTVPLRLDDLRLAVPGGSYHTPDPALESPGDSLWQRLFSGARRVLQRPGWDDFAGRDWIDRIMNATVTDRFNAKQGRSTGRWVLEADSPTGEPRRHLTVYLKRHHELPWWLGWMAALWPRGNWSPALQEWEHLEWARRQGVPVPEAVAAGEFIGPRGRLQSFLAVRELTGMLPLHEAIPLAAQRLDPVTFVRWKRGLVAEMARLARMLHDRRCFHKDLYLCHFYISSDDLDHVPEWRERVFLIDLHRLAQHRWTGWLWQMKDLAQLLYSSEISGVDVRDRLSFWREYRERGSSALYARWLRYWIVLKWRRYRRHNARRKPPSET